MSLRSRDGTIWDDVDEFEIYELWCNCEKTSWYCRECGAFGLYVKLNDNDYYVGPDYYCPSCDAIFTMG